MAFALSDALHGFFAISWLQWLAWALGLTHITILGVTLYYHRGSAHKSIDFHPALAHFFRFWVWATTGMSAREWTGVHRKHHAKCETDEDPHSPQRRGLSTVFFKGVFLYRAESKNPETLARYTAGIPNGPLERFYANHSWLGMILMLAIEVAAFGALKGVSLWVVQLLWIPFWAAGVVNGVGHFWGYRNHDCDDASRNLSPWGIIIGGEELHNNHHAFPASAKLSCKPWEFDWGWAVLRALQWLRLAKARRVMPQLKTLPSPLEVSAETVHAVIAGRFHALRDARRRLSPWVKQTLSELPAARGVSRKRFIQWYFNAPDLRLSEALARRFEAIVAQSPHLARARQALSDLAGLWTKASMGKSEIVEAFKAWCHHSEASGIEALRRFSMSLRGYQLVPSATPA